jgi:hypothetical protein
MIMFLFHGSEVGCGFADGVGEERLIRGQRETLAGLW